MIQMLFSFKNFLKEHNLTSVHHKDPNMMYDLYYLTSGKGEVSGEILTDGNIEELSYSEAKGYIFPAHITYQVTGATWLIKVEHDTMYNNHNHARILYTLKDPMSIQDLPVLPDD